MVSVSLLLLSGLLPLPTTHSSYWTLHLRKKSCHVRSFSCKPKPEVEFIFLSFPLRGRNLHFGFSGIKIHPYRQGIPSARPFQRCTGKKINFVSRFSFFSFERNICDWNSFLENSYVLCLSLPWYSVGIVKREQQSFLFQTKPFSFSVCAESVGSSGAAEGDNPFTFGGAGRPATSIKSLKNQPVEPNSALAPPCIPHTTHLSGVNQGRKILTHRIHEDSLFSIVHMGTPHWKVTVFHRLDVSGVCAILFVCYTNK